MKTNFKDYLKKKKAQNVIDKFAKTYENNKIVLFGADLFTGDLFRNYDLSALNIIGIADESFKNNQNGDYYGYKKISPYDLPETEFDILLITAYDDLDIKDFVKNNVFKDKEIKFKIKTLVKMNFFEYVKAVLNGDV